ncbi:hypothetical protein ACFODO_13085 [Acinetobacter sichuanensis]|uniref:Uncharacterized protein n=1 Tax=Acinetobacter sichuanensis TaxID=2136183 RepID=A0A371YP58_9GAMM|nr:hypothetical protein [Acinetobacter sichuanensis]RFC83255.1 hypothetical protein C9E89_011930 [Acinetobacter sichuanensis]
MDIQKIKELALANGFSLKEQASGNMDLHSYVYEFAQAIENEVLAQARSVFGQKSTIQKEKKLFNEYWHENNLPFEGEEEFKKYAWQAAKAQAIPKLNKCFSYDGNNYEFHNTLAEAKHEAEHAIEYFRDCLADQQLDPESDGNFQRVSYGVVLTESGYSVDHVVTQEDVDNGTYSYDVGTEIMSLFLNENQSVPEGFVLLSYEDVTRLMRTIDFLGVKALGDKYISFSEIHKIVEELQEQG